jgi:hypothetical protein
VRGDVEKHLYQVFFTKIFFKHSYHVGTKASEKASRDKQDLQITTRDKQNTKITADKPEATF